MADQQFRALSSCLVIAFLMVKVTAEKNGMEEDCLSPLGMEDGRIKDDQLRASSFLNDQSRAANSRLNHQDGYGGWCPNQTASGIRTGPFHYNQFILVTLNMPVRIKGVATQGRYNGKEKVDHYWIGFKPHIRTKRLGMVPDEQKPIKLFEGNINSEMHTNILKPSIVVEQICIIPEVNKDKQVCMRFELLGCPLKYGLVSYTIPQGNTREGRYNFTDSSYDGFTKGHFLSDGIGMLTDGKLAPANYVDNNGLGWIGWNAKDTPKPYIIFEFLNTRIFRAMTLHCNVRDTAKIKLFSKVKVRFSMDGGYSSKSIVYNTLNVSSGSSWINYNVTIDLNQRTGKLMKLEFSYTAGQWILISEVTFHSVQTDLRLPATTTRPTTQRQQDISTTYGPTTTAGTVEKEANEVLSETTGKKIGTLRCRGLKPPAVRGHAAAFRYWFNAFGHSGPYRESIVEAEGQRKLAATGNPMNAPAVQQTIKQLCKRAVRPTTKDIRHGRVPYEPKKAPPFTLQQLMRMRQFCLKTVEGMRVLWMWTITVFSFALFLRGEEPLRLKLRHLKLPSNYSADSGKLPKRIDVKIPWSKADRKAKGVTLSLWANPLKRELCPVAALFVWLLITGIKKGHNYIFPRVTKNNRTVIPNSARGVTSYRKQFLEMSKTLFETEFTTHSIRRSAARWAARCGANDTSIKRAGRWKSNSYELYTQDARAEMIKEHHDGHPVLDHKLWMFKPLR